MCERTGSDAVCLCWLGFGFGGRTRREEREGEAGVVLAESLLACLARRAVGIDDAGED